MVKLNKMKLSIEKMKDNFERTKCEVFSRVCGYLRPISGYNDGKKSEFHERVNFDVNKKNEQEETCTEETCCEECDCK
jgi:hypothetical protein